jgi:hypothetical protein
MTEPLRRALTMPPRTRSRINSRSNSATAETRFCPACGKASHATPTQGSLDLAQ